jgi:aspartyl-tRNA(Asn)/glutamyl-tRNA(Gln) amidotransferase subunit A
MPIDRRDFLRDAARAGALALAGSALGHPAPALARTLRPSAPPPLTMTIAEYARQLAAGTITSRQLVERALAAIDDPQGEGARTFLAVHRQSALAAADRVDARRRAGETPSPLAGIPISLKDLFDEAGQVTRGGSTVLAGAPAATRDSVVVERLRAAGAIIVGRTNLTEFAYSGLGINPHYGTPRNAYDRAAGRVPGGSSSGAAVSVTDGMAVAAIGTDTGGSVRIPAALNGLVGFKPTMHRVPMDGALPLSYSLDSAGPLARSVADCVLVDRVLSGDTQAPPAPATLRGLRLAVPTTVFHDELAPDVARAFAAALQRLSAAGAVVTEIPMREIADAAAVSPRGALASAEAFAVHRRWLKDGADQYDPRVLSRIRPGEALSAADYIDLQQLRRRFIRTIAAASRDYDALLMPTTPDSAPTIAEAGRDDATYFRYNTRMLRNTAIVNLFDGTALSIPCQEPGAAPVGLMVAGPQDADRKILAVGLAVESVVWKKG